MIQYVKRNIFTISCLTLAVLLSATTNAWSQGRTVMEIAMDKTGNTFIAVRTIVFILGGFGLVMVAFLAIFGKVNWKWFAGLAVGLAILAAAGAVINYATSADGSGKVVNWSDPLTEGGGSIRPH